MARQVTEITINEHGDETHESWIRVGANKVSGTPHSLFDSDIKHQHFVRVRVERCTRRRDLNRDWLHNTQLLMEFDMSQAQWGAFVSSFGDGGGVPATLSFLTGVGDVPSAPFASRFDQSHAEVREAGQKALSGVKASYAKVMEAFEVGGKKALREALTNLGHTLNNAVPNMEFAASSLTEHVENVVAKARADIEAMALEAVRNGELPQGAQSLLGSGNDV